MKKAIRDGYPQFALQHGAHMQFEQVEGEEWQQAILNQIYQELGNLSQDPSFETLAEIMDLLETFAQSHGWSWNTVEQERINNEEQFGSFSHRLVVNENTEIPTQSRSSSVLHRKNYNYPQLSAEVVEQKIKGERPTVEQTAPKRHLPEVRQASVLAERTLEN